jgi:hypothetical protein
MTPILPPLTACLTDLTTDLTIKRVIIGVLAMLVVLPALEITSGVYGEAPSLLLAGLSMLHATALTQGHNSTGFQAALSVSHRVACGKR